MQPGDDVTPPAGDEVTPHGEGLLAVSAVLGAAESISYGSVATEEELGAERKPQNWDQRLQEFAPYVAEFIGTFVLVFTAGCVTLSPTPVEWQPTANACILIVMIYSTAMVSGGHLNPAVTLTLGLVGALPVHRMLGYWLVQLAGGVAGSGCFCALLGRRSIQPSAPYSAGAGMLVELLYTAFLCFVVNSCIVSKRNNPRDDRNQSWALAIGFVYIAGGHALSQISGDAILNPAIAVGISCMDSGNMLIGLTWSLAELAGAALAARLFCFMRLHSEGCCIAEEHLELCLPRLSARLLAELLGSFALVLTFGLNLVSQSKATAWSTAAALSSLTYALSNISGAHFNPAVTLAVVLSGRRKCSVPDGLAYASAQVLGGVLAGILAAAFLAAGPHAKQHLALQQHGYGIAIAGIAEGVFTFLLAYVVLACATVTTPKSWKTRQNFYFALAIGFAYAGGSFAVAAMSGGELNSAISVGITIMNLLNWSFLDANCLKFSTFQMAGGLMAAIVFRVTHPREYSKAPLLGTPGLVR